LVTKSKNIKYSAGAKTAAFIVVWLSVMCAVGSAMFLIYNHGIVASKTFYDTDQFKNEFSQQIYDLVDFHVQLKSEASIKASGAAEDVVQNNLNRYYNLKKKLPDKVNFVYCITNSQTGETITNVQAADPVALLKKQSSVVSYNQWTASDDSYPMGEKLLAGTPFEVYAAVIEPLKPGDVFYNDFIKFNQIKTLAIYMVPLLVGSIILMIVTFIYLVVVTGRKAKGGPICLAYLDRIYADVYSLLVFVAAVISVAIVGSLSFQFQNQVVMFIIALVFGIDVLIGLSYILSMVRQVKNGQLFRNTLTYKFFALVFSGQNFKAWTLLLLLGYGAINGILLALATHAGGSGFFFSLFFIIPLNIAVVDWAAKSLRSLAQIMEAAKEISAGNLDYALDNAKISVAFSSFAKDVQSIQGGLKKAVAEAVKGERMKTDLITNVSHDLKTPLTSVINYVDLLKQEELNNEKAEQYLDILEEKSARLKQLIEDLIEASKASSGNLAVNEDKVDLNELVLQAYGEYEEKFRQADLEVHIAADKIVIAADGKHMWRIVENLLSNAVKYSLPHTRVYINVAKSETRGVLIVKNISANPLDIPPEQLTERFVRGDLARTTEGSGLGLSIAQSLTNLQRGRFNIETDGDLFKVTVEMPLWEEAER